LNDKRLTIERMENALEYRATTDDEYAEKKTDVLRCEILCKRVRARVFVAEEGSVDLRKAKAEGHGDVIAADEALVDATVAFERLRASRETADSLIEATRTVEASRRKT
jgi:hypothetical protein